MKVAGELKANRCVVRRETKWLLVLFSSCVLFEVTAAETSFIVLRASFLSCITEVKTVLKDVF